MGRRLRVHHFLLVELDIPAHDDASSCRIPNAPAFLSLRVPNKVTFPNLRVKLSSLVLRYENRTFAAPYSQVLNVRLLSLEDFIRSLVLFRSNSWRSIPKIICSHDCFTPKFLCHGGTMQHTPNGLHQGTIVAFSHTVLLRI